MIISFLAGLGVWQTVSVKEVDEVQEAEEYSKAIEQVYNPDAELEKMLAIPSSATSSHVVREPVMKTYKGISIEDNHESMVKFVALLYHQPIIYISFMTL